MSSRAGSWRHLGLGRVGMRQKWAALCCVLGALGCDTFSGPKDPAPLDQESLLAHVGVLAADSLFGRGSGSIHEMRAGEYVRGEFVDYGLQPGAPDYFQTFQFEPRQLTAGPRDSVHGDAASVAPGQLTSQNVLGVLAGRGTLAGQWVILGAHYDHLGSVQVSVDSIVVYNGADDNASGTSLMLEVARYLSDYFRGFDAARRSIMFQAYGAEEEGLKGSWYFVQHPTIPLDSVVAMVNLDMVGRLRDRTVNVTGTGTSPVWSPLLDAENRAGLTLDTGNSYLTGSDHYPFLVAGKPALFFFTGLHAEYHTPGDDGWLMNGAGMIEIGDLVVAVLLDLAVRSEPPPFVGL